MKRIAFVLAAAAVSMTACGEAAPPPPDNGAVERKTTSEDVIIHYVPTSDDYQMQVFEYTLELADGRVVRCVAPREDRGIGNACFDDLNSPTSAE